MAMNEMDMSELMEMNVLETEQQAQNPIELIKSDHRRIESLFERFEGTEDKKQKLEIAKRICSELKVHAQYEEELVYPLVLEQDEDAGEEAELEHELIKFMIGELDGVTARDKTMEPKVKVLKDLVEHHVEEEENNILPELEDNEELQARAEQIVDRKMQLMEKIQKGGRLSTRKSTKKAAAAGKTAGTKRTSTSRKATVSRGRKTARGAAGNKELARKGARKSAQVRSAKKQTNRRAR